MKFTNKILAVLAAAAGLLAVSCEDQPDAFKLADGVPVVHYVRPVDVTQADSLLTGAYLEASICLVGENLRSVHQMYFNDQKAILNTSYMTDNTLIVQVPNAIPGLVTDKMYLINKNQDTVKVDFQVLVPPPAIKGMSCEWAPAGSMASLYGDYFVDDPAVPFHMVFAGAEVDPATVNVTKTEVTFMVPEDAVQGEKISVTTVYGSSESVFLYKDNRGLITDFDGSTDVVPQGWNIKVAYKEEGGISGNYAELGPAASPLDESGAWNEEYKLPFWCGTWNGDPMGITSGPGVPICNIIDFTDWKNMALKFELCIPSSNPWSSGAMQLVFTSAERCANDTWQNNTYIHTSKTDGGLDLCRGMYTPWLETGSFDTGDKWITVTVPFEDFKYNADGTEGKVALSGPDDFASLIIWPWSGGVNGTSCTPIFRYDNIRAVPNK